MFEHLIEFTHTMQEIVRIYHKHDTSMNAKLDALLAELKAILAELKKQNAHRN